MLGYRYVGLDEWTTDSANLGYMVYCDAETIHIVYTRVMILVYKRICHKYSAECESEKYLSFY